MHKVFIKDALFELNGIILILINLVILLEIKVLAILLLLFISQAWMGFFQSATCVNTSQCRILRGCVD